MRMIRRAMFHQGGKKVIYYGRATDLSSVGYKCAASIGDYAIFVGDYDGSSIIDAYNSSLVKSTPPAFGQSRYNITTASNLVFAIFAGGVRYDYSVNEVTAYNSSLVRSTATLQYNRDSFAGARAGEYAVFGGGLSSFESGGTFQKNACAFNGSLVRSDIADLSNTQGQNRAASAGGEYALIGGGTNATASATLDAYNSSLVKTTTSMSSDRYGFASTTTSSRAVFAGGVNWWNTYRSSVDFINSSLLRTTVNLSTARRDLTGASLEENALFGGGRSTDATYNDTVDIFDESLVRTVVLLPDARSHMAGVSVGDFALFGAGSPSALRTKVDVFQYK